MTTPNLELPEVPEAILGASDEINEGFWSLDAVVQLSVIDKDLATPPVGAIQGSRYIVPVGAVGLWATKDRSVAFLGPQGWRYYRPRVGWVAYVEDEATNYRYTGTAWVIDTASGGSLTVLDDSSSPFQVTGVTALVFSGFQLTDQSDGSVLIEAPSDTGGSDDAFEAIAEDIRWLNVSHAGSALVNRNWSIGSTCGASVQAKGTSALLLATARQARTASGAINTRTSLNSQTSGEGVYRQLTSSARYGKFNLRVQFGFVTTKTDMRFFLGLAGTASVLSNSVDLSGNAPNHFALLKDQADTNLQLCHRTGSGTAVKIDLGVSAATLQGRLLQLTISGVAGGAALSYDLHDVDNAVHYTGSVSTDLPAADQELHFHLVLTTGSATTTAVQVDFGRAIQQIKY